ncbi:membrane attack complex component/perforin (macpf)-domain-containing protein [Aspergillus terreus]|uniref:Membrane attack complex component/perforin (Macpf)-domain-containing protein n=1 Tax=Aspergillus terreus TaxID=33178 RepID=A0A5M3ZEH5_ASPTE|nr:hypothetical protein ATETN484_0017002900 [Aspergillus terreus]GFF21704.1 membrane attack complex component/perforin (macpf)-domain-containing protein [Aspergillus terreus]
MASNSAKTSTPEEGISNEDVKTECLSPKNAESVLRVHQYDPVSGTVLQKRIIQLGDARSLLLEKLSRIRVLLAKENVFDSPDVGSPFCDFNGSEVADNTDIAVYFSLVEDSSNDAKEGSSPGLADQMRVYYKKKALRTQLSSETQEFLRQKLDLTLKNAPDLPKADVQLLKSTFDPRNWSAGTGGAKLSHAAELSEQDWSVLTRTNCLLSGHKLGCHEKKGSDGEPKKELRVERSPYNAFTVKKRTFNEYEISASIAKSKVSEGPATTPEASKFAFRIPRFRVDDDSYIGVYETKNSLEHSLAKNSFSETSVDLSAGGGFWGVSAAASAGFGKKDTNASVTAESEENDVMNISYNARLFPRVTVYMDPSSLEISEECMNDISNVIDSKSLKTFREKYGDIFAQRVQLGGTLQSSQPSKAISGQSKEDKSHSLKVSAAASFSSSAAQASLSASHERGNASAEVDSKRDLTSSMAWEAKGGDSLLANNPSEWCSTVGDFYNWRIVEQGDVLPLYKVLSACEGSGDVATRFEMSAEDKFSPPRWLECRFKLFDRDTGVPVRFCKDDKTLYEKVKSDFDKMNNMVETAIRLNKAPKIGFRGTPFGGDSRVSVIKPFADYQDEVLNKIAKAQGSFLSVSSTTGTDVLGITSYFSAGESVEMRYWKHVYGWIDPSPTETCYWNVSSKLEGYYTDSYLYNGDRLSRSNVYFISANERLKKGAIGEGDSVIIFFRDINSPYDWLGYLAKTSEGLLRLQGGNDSPEEADTSGAMVMKLNEEVVQHMKLQSLAAL